MNKYLSILIAPLLFSSQTFAQSPYPSYGGIQYAMVNYDEEGFPDAKPSALGGRLGTFFSDKVALEARFGIGLQDDTITVTDPIPADLDLEVDYLFGVYGVFHSGSQASDGLSFYGVFGFTQAELSASTLGITVSGDDTSMSYGLGAQFGGFTLEYMDYLHEDDYDATAISFGYITNF